MKNNNEGCLCNGGLKLIFACSGASDTGELTDRAARQLAREGTGKMFCLAGIGGRVSGIMASTEAASKVLAIDGCPLDCAKKTLEVAGYTGFAHISLADMGIEKGKSPVTDKSIAKIVSHSKSLLND